MDSALTNVSPAAAPPEGHGHQIISRLRGGLRGGREGVDGRRTSEEALDADRPVAAARANAAGQRDLLARRIVRGGRCRISRRNAARGRHATRTPGAATGAGFDSPRSARRDDGPAAARGGSARTCQASVGTGGSGVGRPTCCQRAAETRASARVSAAPTGRHPASSGRGRAPGTLSARSGDGSPASAPAGGHVGIVIRAGQQADEREHWEQCSAMGGRHDLLIFSKGPPFPFWDVIGEIEALLGLRSEGVMTISRRTRAPAPL